MVLATIALKFDYKIEAMRFFVQVGRPFFNRSPVLLTDEKVNAGADSYWFPRIGQIYQKPTKWETSGSYRFRAFPDGEWPRIPN